jgi:hypothetical protein
MSVGRSRIVIAWRPPILRVGQQDVARQRSLIFAPSRPNRAPRQNAGEVHGPQERVAEAAHPTHVARSYSENSPRMRSSGALALAQTVIRE